MLRERPSCPNIRSEQGASLVEMALVLPILVLFLFGIFEFGRAYNAKVTLTHATRESVRVLAITGDPAAAETRLVEASSPLDSSLLTFSSTACDDGEPTSVTATYPFSYDIPLFGQATISMSSTAVMRCNG